MCKILLARRAQVVPASQLSELLWPGEDPQAGRSRLHVRISQLRRTLGDGKSWVQTVDGGYLFNPDERCWLDTAAFEAAAARAVQLQEQGQQLAAIESYEQAHRLYRGDFLAEDLYLDWTFPQREAYRERYLVLLAELAECYAQQGRYRLAAARLQEALTRDPLRESIYVRLMLYHYYAGERTQALRVFERCRQLLADELQVAPLDSTSQLVEQIRDGSLWSSAQSPHYPPPIYEGRLFEVPYSLSETPLVGREREYAWLVKQWQDEHRRLILVGGEAGVGKSRLAEAFAGYIHSQGWQVLLARLAPGEGAPLALLAAALQPLLAPANLSRLSPLALASLAVLFPEIKDTVGDLPALPALPAQVARRRMYQAVEALASACPLQRTLLLVDDAQRLGSAAVEVLARLNGSLKMLLVYRSEETPPDHPVRKDLQGALPADRAAGLEIEALTSGSVQQLIRQLAGSDLPELAAEIYERTQGNPLFIVALLQHLFETGQLYVEADGGWSLTVEPAVTLPPTVQEAVEARLARLNAPQRRVFDLAAVLGGEFDFDLLQQASQQPEEELLALLDELIDLALINEPRRLGHREFAVVHDRYCEVACATLPGVRRRQLHQQAARAIEQLYASALEAFYPALADHFGQAEIFESENHYARLAGEQAAARFDNTKALHYLERSLALTGLEEHAARAQMLLVREGVFDLQGDRARQQADLEALADLSPHLEAGLQAKIALRQAAYAWIVGDDAAASARLAEAIPRAHDCQAVEIEAAGLLLRGRGGQDQAQAQQDLERALLLAQQHNLRAMEGDILRCLGNSHFWQNNFPASEKYFERALAVHREVGDVRGEQSVLNNLAFLYQLLGEYQAASEFYRQALEISRQIGDRLAEGVLLSNLGDQALQLGDYGPAAQWLEQALEIREQIENEEGAAVVLQRLGDLYRQQGQYDRAQACYQRARAISARIKNPGIEGESLERLGRLQCEMGDYEQAQADFEQAGRLLPDPDKPGSIRLLSSWSWLHCLRGDPAAALEAGQLALTRSEKLPQIQAAALTHVGRALAELGELQAAREHYTRALDIRERLQQPHLAVEPRSGLAELALQQGDLQQAGAQIEPILDILQVGPLAGPEEAPQIYLTCYEVLTACQDARASQVIEAAYAYLQQRGRSLCAPAARQRYLEKPGANREIFRRFRNPQ